MFGFKKKQQVAPPRPGQKPPKVGQIIQNTRTGRTIMVVGVEGQVAQPPLSVSLVGSALRAVGRDNPAIGTLLGYLAVVISDFKYSPGSVLLADGSAYAPSPWPPDEWEVVGHLQGARAFTFTPTTEAAKALSAEIAAAEAAAAEAAADDEDGSGGEAAQG